MVISFSFWSRHFLSMSKEDLNACLTLLALSATSLRFWSNLLMCRLTSSISLPISMVHCSHLSFAMGYALETFATALPCYGPWMTHSEQINFGSSRQKYVQISSGCLSHVGSAASLFKALDAFRLIFGFYPPRILASLSLSLL